jgi:glycosyltransferase involved in cell wall biosynthesis
MPPRVSYWTGVWAPRFEAHSQEIEALRATTSPRGTVVSAATGQRARRPQGGVYRVDAGSTLLLIALARWLEPRADVTHLFGATDNWHLLRRLGRRPLLFTVTIPGTPQEPSLYGKVTLFAAETEGLAAQLIRHGADPARIEIVPPGVDLERFAPTPLPAPTPFRILFATAPPTPELFAERGIPPLIELARLRSDVEVTLLWRPWGDLARCLAALRVLDPPPNVRIEVREHGAVPLQIGDAHAVACCFDGGRAKAAPQSLIEGLACGRPALVTRDCGLAGLVEECGAGVTSSPRGEDLSTAVDVLRSRLSEMSRAARSLAEERFDRVDFLSRYRALYDRLAGVVSN